MHKKHMRVFVIKDKFYRTTIRLIILYGSESWALKEQHKRKVRVAKMRPLREMCNHIRKDRIQNKIIQEKIIVTPIKKKMTKIAQGNVGMYKENHKMYI